MYHRWGVKYTMGRWVQIPWVEGQNTIGWGFDVP